MKEKLNQMFKDKLFLVMLVLGLLTIVAAAGVVTMQKGNGQEQNPYMDMQGAQQFLAEESADDSQTMVAGDSNAANQTEEKLAAGNSDSEANSNTPETNWQVADNSLNNDMDVEPVDSGLDAATALVLNFSDSSKMGWPIQGNVVLDYSMESTIYFPTLNQYQCNPALIIQGEADTPVYAPANARVLEVGSNEEIGNYLKLDLGNEYTSICGQLKDVAVAAGEYLEQGQLLGYIEVPTKYYSIEGTNLFLKLMHQEKPVDPLDYLE